jgi:hypothetical protein
MKFKIYIVSLISITFFPAIQTKAQFKIFGTVLETGTRSPIDSVTITNQNGNNAVIISGANGFFNLTTSGDNTILISAVGYINKSIVIKSDTIITIFLLKENSLLHNVIVLSESSKNIFNSISKVDISLLPMKSTQDLLRLMPGLFIAQHAGGGKAEQIFLRGFDNDHGTDIAVSVDGLPVNMVSHAHGQGYADAHFIIPETIKTIDYGGGCYYANQGNLNTSGYIAFNSAREINVSKAQLEAGSFNTARVLLMLDLIKKNKQKESAYIASEFNYTDGPTDNKQFFNRFNVFGNYIRKVNRSLTFRATASAFKSSWNASGQIPQRAVDDGTIGRFGSIDPTEGGIISRYNLNFFAEQTLSKNRTFVHQLFAIKNKFELYSNFTFFLEDPISGDGIVQKEDRNIIGFRSTFDKKGNLGIFKITSTYGVGFRYDASNSLLSSQIKRTITTPKSDGIINELNSYAFLSEQIKYKKFQLELALRDDYFQFRYRDLINPDQLPQQAKSILSPKLNVQYNSSKVVQLYLKAGKGFHSNDSRVVVQNRGQEILPASYGSDLGIFLKPTKNLFINVAVWNLYLQQEFVYVGDAAIVEPSGRSFRQGLDLITRYQLGNNLFANLNMNFTRPRSIDEEKGNDYIPLAPTFTSTAALTYKKQKGFGGMLSYRVIGDRAANEDYSITAKGYFLLDGAVSYSANKYELGLYLENILNVKWNEAQFATESRLQNEINSLEELHFTPGSPANIRLKLAVNF